MLSVEVTEKLFNELATEMYYECNMRICISQLSDTELQVLKDLIKKCKNGRK